MVLGDVRPACLSVRYEDSEVFFFHILIFLLVWTLETCVFENELELLDGCVLLFCGENFHDMRYYKVRCT